MEDIIKAKARSFLESTEWHEMAERALNEPMPEWVRKKREEAQAILEGKKSGEEHGHCF